MRIGFIGWLVTVGLPRMSDVFPWAVKPNFCGQKVMSMLAVRTNIRHHDVEAKFLRRTHPEGSNPYERSMLFQSQAYMTTRKLANSFSKCFIMSVDVDDWSSVLRFYSVKHVPDKANAVVDVNQGINILLNLFDRHKIKATFFVPGDVAEKNSSKIKEIAAKGHEVACHGLHHDKNECVLGPVEQFTRIRKALIILKNIIGRRPLGFRAPCLRANNVTLEVLERLGFLYDSSFLPMFIPRVYGSLSPNFKPYFPSLSIGSLVEIPVSVNPIVRFPLSGSWMRNLGPLWVKFGVKMLFDLGIPVMIYIHPRDVVSLPRVHGVPWHIYRNTGSNCLNLLDELLSYVKLLGGHVMRAIDLVSTITLSEISGEDKQ